LLLTFSPLFRIVVFLRTFGLACKQEALDEILNPDAQRGISYSEFVALDTTRAAIHSEFHQFLTQFVDKEGHSVYGEKIKRMVEGEFRLLT
jgi:hypothetical protein